MESRWGWMLPATLVVGGLTVGAVISLIGAATPAEGRAAQPRERIAAVEPEPEAVDPEPPAVDEAEASAPAVEATADVSNDNTNDEGAPQLATRTNPRRIARVRRAQRSPHARRSRRAPQALEEPSALPTMPRRDDVRAAMLAARPAVLSCATDRGGIAMVTVTISPNGRVRNAHVGRDFRGTPEGSCIARAVRTAHFPRFSGESLTLTYPFTVPRPDIEG